MKREELIRILSADGTIKGTYYGDLGFRTWDQLSTEDLGRCLFLTMLSAPAGGEGK